LKKFSKLDLEIEKDIFKVRRARLENVKKIRHLVHDNHDSKLRLGALELSEIKEVDSFLFTSNITIRLESWKSRASSILKSFWKKNTIHQPIFEIKNSYSE
jgi:hypothetical protein